MRKILIPLLVFVCSNIWAQDFGFGFDDDDTENSASRPQVSLKASGEIAVEATPYIYDFNKNFDAKEISFWNARLNLTVSSLYIDVFTNFNFNAGSITELWSGSPDLKELNHTPLIIDEAFLRAYIGPVNIEAGYRKLSWGRADSPGPLDVTNPVDYSDLRNITDTRAGKIARPMLHVTWNTGSFSKLEGVFIPNFAGHRFASQGRWAPSQLTNMLSTAEAGISSMASAKFGTMALNPALKPTFDNVKNSLISYLDDNPITFPSTSGIKYFQAGLRYTATIGSADVGGQYFYGNLFRPNFTIAGVDDYLDDLARGILGALPPFSLNPLYPGNPALLSPQIKYSRYHQFGIDYAQVLYDFNVRGELAFHLTEDLKGDDGSVQNPFIGWSLGFDRVLNWGINLNLQLNETIRLFNGKVGDNPVLDAEAGKNATATRLSIQISKKFLRDNLESKATVIWDIENIDCYIIPAVVWTVGNLNCELSSGIFAGKESGEFGQYWRNCFIKLGVKYSF